MADILLVTLNARYSHASLGLRWLKANLGELEPRAEILEFVTGARTELLAQRILARQPRIVGLGVYIWNVEETTRLAAMLRVLAPDLVLVGGGPELSYEFESQRLFGVLDHLVTGPGELAFAGLCRQALGTADAASAAADDESRALAPAAAAPLPKVIAGIAPRDPDSLALPYRLYDDRDIAQRYLYVEASRGCPFKCEFCLSALDRTAVPFDTERLLAELEALHARGARTFKFVDRTFNLKVDTSRRILEFFLGKLEAAPDDPVFAHFELVPDHLPERLRETIARFPAGALQFEIGIQTWNPTVQTLISRRQNDEKAEQNIRWLVTHTQAHLHVDLIAGLPGEDLASFGAGFDRLLALGPHEIQLGILKRLRGAPIARHTESHGLRFNPEPPYNVLATDRIDFEAMQRFDLFARLWDRVANSGRYPEALPMVLGTVASSVRSEPASRPGELPASPFWRFMDFTDWMAARDDGTARWADERLRRLIGEWLIERACAPAQAVRQALRPPGADAARAGLERQSRR
jgi:radical SAM superfamily enzyme YgiQ (UPF0313 family)